MFLKANEKHLTQPITTTVLQLVEAGYQKLFMEEYIPASERFAAALGEWLWLFALSCASLLCFACLHQSSEKLSMREAYTS